jgi:hypothetical protein
LGTLNDTAQDNIVQLEAFIICSMGLLNVAIFQIRPFSPGRFTNLGMLNGHETVMAAFKGS